MKRFYQVFAFFLLLHLWAPCLKGQPVAPTGAVQVLEVRSVPVEDGKKLKVNLTITNYEQLSEIVILHEGTPASSPGLGGDHIINYTPYYYLGELFLVYRDKKVPFTGNAVELLIDLNPGTESSSLTVFALDRNHTQSAPVTHQYK